MTTPDHDVSPVLGAPTLIVDGPPSDWLPTEGPTFHDPGMTYLPPVREWLAIETLPFVPYWQIDVWWAHRGLRAGDSVTLAEQDDIGAGQVRVLPFATAEMAEVRPIYNEDVPDTDIPDGLNHVIYNQGAGTCDLFTWLPTISFWECEQNIDLPGARPGGFAVRLINVKELT